MRQKADKSSVAFFNKLLCIQKSTIGRMTLFSESGILSVKTGGIRDGKVTMRNWEPYVYDGEYNLSGTADVHPRLGRNVYVATTSTLVKASLEEDVLIYETRNTVYHCPLKYMMVSPYGNVVQEYREELARLDTSENALTGSLPQQRKCHLESRRIRRMKW